MVERPIKKSERLANEAANGGEELIREAAGDSEQVGSRPSRSPRPVSKSNRDRDNNRDTERGNDRGNDRDKRRGKGGRKGGKSEDIKPPVNLALMRGPKPTQPKPPVVEEVPEVAEDVNDEATEADTESPSEGEAIEATSSDDAAEPSS
jgi:hypothetical protein